MRTFLLALSILWALFGHTVLCIALVNRIHAAGLSIRFGKLVWLSLIVIVPALPILFLFWFWVRAQHMGGTFTLLTLPPAALPYLATCWLAAVAIIVHWFRRHVTGSPPGSLRSDRHRVFRLLQKPETLDSEDHEHHFLVRLPGNQILELDVAERGLNQLPWAQRNEVDLLLAGHLHGGQIRIPFLGPIVSPSWHGVRYASGVFHSSPTLMHVSRGVSGEVPLRLNCRPEITKLTLHSDSLPNRTT